MHAPSALGSASCSTRVEHPRRGALRMTDDTLKRIPGGPVPLAVKIGLAWLPFFVLWVLFIRAYVPTVTLGEALFSATTTIGGAAALGFGAWWFSGRYPWPERLKLSFYLVHLMVGLLYASLWLGAPYAIEAFQGNGNLITMLRESNTIGWQLLTGVWLYGFVTGVSYSIRIRARLREQERVAARAEALAVDARLQALRAQVNPHFLFNALHSLSALIRYDAAAAQTAVDRLGDLLRYALDESDDDEVMLREEWSFTLDYLEVERIRFGDRLRFDVTFAPETLGCAVPPFCLQPLVENAVRYAVASRPEGGHITIESSIERDELRLRVSDDGPGSDGEGTPGGGRGLRTLEARLLALYHGRAAITTVNKPGEGFRVQITLPANGTARVRQGTAVEVGGTA
jgi:signal transduction histidine kinase